MIWGKKESPMLQQRGEGPDHREWREREGGRERESKRARCRILHQKNTCPKPLAGKMRGL